MPYGADNPAALARHQAKLAHRRCHLTEAVGLLAMTVGAERLVQQRLNGSSVLGLLEFDGDGGHWRFLIQRAGGLTVSGTFEELGGAKGPSVR